MKVDPSTGVYLIAVAAATTLVLSIRTDIIYVIFVLSLVTTSFFSVEVGESYLRIPFILNFFVLLFLPKRALLRAAQSRIFLCFVLYVVWTLLVTAYSSGDYLDSFRIAGLPMLLLLISLNVAAIIGSGKLPLENAVGLLVMTAALNIILGLLQYVGFFGFGANVLTLTEQQWIQISQYHRMTATFWEGDTFGKYLMAFTLLMLPLTVEMYRKGRRNGLYIVMFAFLSLMVNQTRSAWVGLAAGLSLFALLGRLALKKKAALILLIVTIATAGFYVITTFEHDSLIRQRAQALMSFESMREDPSAAYRLESVEDTWRLITADADALLFGNGFVEMGEDYKGASNIFLHIMVTSGAVGLSFFVLAIIALLYRSFTFASPDPAKQHVARGVGLATVGMLVASQLAPMVIDPVFWMVIGLGILFETASRKRAEKALRVVH
ncbi:MAG: O-antigen ligase family protein [Candidatus Sulfobium sp.]